MSITSVQKTSLLVVILIIVGAGAFVYFDPLDLDLLSLKQKPAAAKPAIPHVASSQAVTPPHPMEAPVAAPSPAHIAVPAAQPPIASLKPAVTPTQTKTTAATPASSPAPAATSTVTVPKAAIAPAQTKVPVATTSNAASVAPTPVLATAQTPQKPLKLSKETENAIKPAVEKPARPKNQDLRYCLDLEIDAAIAKCAGE